MKNFRSLFSLLLTMASMGMPVAAQKKATLGDNAALRYWAAFSAMQDSAITSQQAKEMNAILDGTAPYDDLKYKELIEKNKLALEIMAHATALQRCDWGLDYGLGEDVPVEYARKALALGRLNLLYAFHLLLAGNKPGTVEALVDGLRFSRDVANGGSLFATLVAKDLLEAHFQAISFTLQTGGISPEQRHQLQAAVAQLGPDPLDWQGAARRDLESLRGRYAGDPQSSAALARITPSYVKALNDPDKLSSLQQMIARAPKQVADLIPKATRVLEQKSDLSAKLAQVRSLLK